MTANHILLFRLAELMLKHEQQMLPVDLLFDDEQISDFVKSIQIDSPYQKLLLEGVLTEAVRDEKLYVSFSVERYFHYVLGMVLEAKCMNHSAQDIFDTISNNKLNGITEGLEYFLLRKVENQKFEVLLWFIDYGVGFNSSTVNALAYGYIRASSNLNSQTIGDISKAIFATPTINDINVIHDVINKLEQLQKKDVLGLVYESVLKYIEPKTAKTAQIFANITQYLSTDEKIENLDFLTTLNFDLNNIEVVNFHQSIGSEWDRLGKYENSIKAFNKALSVITPILDNYRSEFAEINNNLGIALMHVGKLDESLEHFNISLEIYIAHFGPEHYSIGTIHNNIGQLFQDKGDLEKALEYYQKALNKDKILYGNYHPNTATTLNNIGSLYVATCKFEDAKTCYDKSLRIFLRIFGELHQWTATIYNNMSLLDVKQNKITSAIEYSQKALYIIENVFGVEHPWYATTVNNIGGIYMESGDLDNAMLYFNKGLIIKRRIHEENHPSIGISIYNIGKCFHDLGDTKQALIYYDKAYVIFKMSLGEEHPNSKRIIDKISQFDDL
jgi:tetratricopeptide (TPR) repeat protein